MNIKDMAQRLVPTVRPQMVHPKAWLVFVSYTMLVILPSYAYIALTMVVTGDIPVSSGSAATQ
jgi:hypothetical protein